MKRCPYCQQAPAWHYASNSTAAANRDNPNRLKWKRYFIFSAACQHQRAFAEHMPVVPDDQIAEVEARWDAVAEQQFAEYTARWTAEERESFRLRLWPPPRAVIPTELFSRYREEEPAINVGAESEDEKHPFAE